MYACNLYAVLKLQKDSASNYTIKNNVYVYTKREVKV
ncbi:hypothetical protein CLV51_10681 [Chitinophaga niastensis]|uniref:Uncharacterized protein n=1 Tax=Chitinophaga niastensis TaxID=536980 RepID=A0A2P8HDA9_CHINA|nr:hypothetical protein CLV51_10681 [Chitinophaga niastensis]